MEWRGRRDKCSQRGGWKVDGWPGKVVSHAQRRECLRDAFSLGRAGTRLFLGGFSRDFLAKGELAPKRPQAHLNPTIPEIWLTGGGRKRGSGVVLRVECSK